MIKEYQVTGSPALSAEEMFPDFRTSFTTCFTQNEAVLREKEFGTNLRKSQNHDSAHSNFNFRKLMGVYTTRSLY